jgi:peptide/nickel transport system substrate-binding protein
MKPLCLLTLIACSLQAGQLRLTLQAEPKTLDPLMAADEPSEIIRYLTSGTLLRLNRVTQTLEPELAKSWKVSEAGRRISFELRGGVRFSDGTPFTATDVCKTMQKALDSALETTVFDTFQVKNSDFSCTVESKTSLWMRFPKPIAAVERLMDGVPMLSWQSPKPESAVLGPFLVAERKSGVSITLARNPHYWKTGKNGERLPYLDSILFEIQRNRDFELRRFRSGELDLVNNLNAELFERLKAETPSAVRDLGVSLDTEQLWFNQVPHSPLSANKLAWFRSREFRLAVSESIKRADMARVVYRGHATPAIGPMSSANKFWYNNKLQVPPGDPKAALARLTKAGFRLQNGVLRDSSGEAVEFSLITNSGNKSRARLAAMIQQDLAAIGMRVTITPLDFPSLIDRIMKTFDYDACLLGLVGGDLDPNSQMNLWVSSSSQHQWNPNQARPATAWEAELDKLMLSQAVETNAAKRKAAFDRVQQIVVEQAPFIYLVYPNALVAAGSRIRGFDPSVLRPQTLWNAERLSLASGGTQ